ncbi:uncharacterized protein LOC116350033 [Contarinia nasturtii]|uniref:uncharacterized protein LOC116350033 n=1 Tax=Contarinia nasturtii TaxID=265458 RepID=UPI0012D3DA52|nr:uncharacterized protein LOC116350033 [Contarinia nasturtii]
MHMCRSQIRLYIQCNNRRNSKYMQHKQIDDHKYTQLFLCICKHTLEILKENIDNIAITYTENTLNRFEVSSNNINAMNNQVQATTNSGDMTTSTFDLPKITPNQQIFSLNSITNQITQLSPSQTICDLGPMDRLLIVPAGVTKQQLANCLIQTIDK